MTPEQFAANQAAQAAEVEAEQAKRAAQQSDAQRMIDARGKTKYDPKTRMDFRTLYAAKAEADAAAAEAAKAALIASISPRDAIIAALSPAQRKRIAAYEAINEMPFPLQVLGITGV